MFKITKKEKRASTRADQIPEQLVPEFIDGMYKQGNFWGDMAVLCVDLAMRNIECRELRAEHYDSEAKTLTLFDSKQVKSWLTKNVNKRLHQLWVKRAGIELYGRLKDSEPTLAGIVFTTQDEAMINSCAQVAGCVQDLEEMREQFYESEQWKVTSEMLQRDDRPTGREIDLSGLTRVINILDKRVAMYGEIGGYLFPACELQSNRARGNGFAPCSRQSAYRVIKGVRELIANSSNKAKELLRGLRISLHSCRKSGVQLVASMIGVEDASAWVGHSSIAVTSAYLDRSEQKRERTIKAINGIIGNRA